MTLARRTPLARGGRLRRTPLRSRGRRDAIPSAVLAALHARSGGRCEARLPGCWGRATDPHHRLMRSQGGGHTDANLLDLCRRCHDRVHANPGESYAAGLLLHPDRRTP